ncbi:aspartate ammonia-lyase [Streptomyces werraensis]|uniref:aspartate ammonia-lyase n=1 Tax=Streptomyces werraensis TaxID=68284 RepID=UPI001CE351FC
MAGKTRPERDSLGTVDVPEAAYYGVHTARAVANFSVTGTTISQFPDLISALAAVKEAAALANRDLGRLDDRRAEAIAAACREVRDGKLLDQFVVDPIQGGAGTSTHMNVNEVIANRALELLGFERGDYAELDPLEHVNIGQSTNDVYPTAIKICLIGRLRTLITALERLASSFSHLAVECQDAVKMGRTQLQDAVPMTLGQEFAAYVTLLREDCERIGEATGLLLESNLGGTAIGTGMHGHPDYSRLACAYLRKITGEAILPAADPIASTQDCSVFVEVSGVVKRAAVTLSKTCNDLRLMSSGPSTGLGEINLPSVQAGSSIMPGKVNPVIPEMVNQVAFEVMGSDVTVTLAAEAGQLQLNPFEPIIVYSLLRASAHLDRAVRALADRCVEGITPNTERLEHGVRNSVGMVTALLPELGYATSAEVAKEALARGVPVWEIAVGRGLLSMERVGELLSHAGLVRLASLSSSGSPPD